MKKTAIIFTLIFTLSGIFSAPAIASVPSARFDFSRVAYEGEVYDAGEYSDGLFMVCANEHKCGFVNGEGEVVIDFIFSYAGSFSNGLAPASVPYGKLGYIDKTGKFIIAPQFDSAKDFSEGLALVTKGDKTGFIDKTGNFTDIIKDNSYTPVTSFSDGVCWVENGDGKRAVMSFDGTLLTDFDFVWSADFSDGVCWASKDMGTDFNHIQMGLIDKSGEFIINPGIYTDAQNFSEGLCWVKKIGENRIYLIDKDANEIHNIVDGLMPSGFSNGICVKLGSDLLSISNTDALGIWSSKKYFPIHYGGFHDGKMIVKAQNGDGYYIMHDKKFEISENENIIGGYGYRPKEIVDTRFEIALLINSPMAYANGTLKQIDEANNNVCAFVENSRTVLPMRFIAENLPGYTVSWDYLTDSALVQSDSVSILLKPNVPYAQQISFMPDLGTYTQNKKTLDQPPINAYDRLFLPVRALGEMIGANVFYDERGIVVLSNTRTALSYDDAGAYLEMLK